MTITTNNLRKYCSGLVEILIGFEVFKSTDTYLLVQELEAMFQKYPEGFARHFEKRNDQANLDGLSWLETLGLKKGKFERCFQEVGIIYRSVEDCESEADKFKGKFYYSVQVQADCHRTYYYRNTKLINGLIDSHFLPIIVESNKDLGIAE